MKVALCLRGHMRTFEAASAYIEDLRKNCELDVFIHTWEDLGFLELREPLFNPKDPGTINLNSGLVDVTSVERLYQPKRLIVENYETMRSEFEKLADCFVEWFEQVKTDSTVGQPRMHSFMSQLYKENAVISLKDAYSAETSTDYDVVIVTRPDVLLAVNKETLHEISQTEGKVWVRSLEYSHFETRGLLHVCNSFFAGTTQTIDKIKQTYPDILKIYNELYSEWQSSGDKNTYARMYCIHQLMHYQTIRTGITPVTNDGIQAVIVR